MPLEHPDFGLAGEVWTVRDPPKGSLETMLTQLSVCDVCEHVASMYDTHPPSNGETTYPSSARNPMGTSSRTPAGRTASRLWNFGPATAERSLEKKFRIVRRCT